MSMDRIYVKNDDFVQREVAGECILIPIRRKLNEVNSIYVLNETGATLWQRLDGKTPMRDIVLDFQREFDVTQAQLEQDTSSLIDDLLSIQAIRETGPTP